jgi:HAE1 family hydrophobic/amphiphilic exporter-1
MIQLAIRRPVTVSMFVVAVALFGLVSLERMALNLLPEIAYPALTILTDYEDAAPEEIENLITRPIEEVVGVVGGLTRVESVSRAGQSEVILEFAWQTNMDVATLEVREKLDLLQLSRDVERPVLLRFDPSYDPVMRLQFWGEVSLSRLRYLADEELKKSLESTEGVAAIKVVGGLEEQIRIEIDEKRLAELRIPITEVTQVLIRENLNQASGSLYDLDANYMVRLLNQFRSVEEIERIILRDSEGRQVVLGEVAEVWRGSKDREVIARIDGRESVELAVYKEGDANTVMVARAVEAKLEKLRQDGVLTENLQVRTVFNQARFIQQAVDNVLWSAVLGAVLATLVLYLFLRHLRSTLLVAVSIPISILATFALMYQMDVSLNIMSLGGIALGVGMLVDNSIVVLEAVHRQDRSQTTLPEAVYRGTREVGTAVTASTLTTLAVFLPLVFVEGIAGQLFKDQALTIVFSLSASLLVALTFIPMVLALQIQPPPPASGKALPEPAPETLDPGSKGGVGRFLLFFRKILRRVVAFLLADLLTVVLADLRTGLQWLGRGMLRLMAPILSFFEAGLGALGRRYPGWLELALNHKGRVFAATGLLVVLAVAAFFRLGAELIPPLTQGEFAFEVRLPEGTPLARTDRLLRTVEREIADLEGVETVFSSAGGSNQNQFARQLEQEHVGQLHLVMKNRRDRAAELRVIESVRSRLSQFPELTYAFRRPTLFSFKTPIEVEIYAYDLSELRAAASQVAARMEGIAGLKDVKTTTRLGNPEIQVRFDRERLARLNLDENSIARILRNKIRGEVASRYREKDKQIDILVRAAESDRDAIQDLKELVINMGTRAFSGTGAGSSSGSGSEGGAGQSVDAESGAARTVPIRLNSVADIDIGRGPGEVRRIGSQRAAVVSANLSGMDLSRASRAIRDELQDLGGRLPATVSLSLAGQNRELATSYRSLLMALALAVFLVYLVMASQFESFIHPLIIMFTVPLGLVGVILALALTATAVSVVVLLGLIILSGIMVNNAILLVDYANKVRRAGQTSRAALLQAGQVRLRPILMTTLTTVLGLSPMALGWGEGAEIRAPMAIAVMGGLLFSALLTLFFIPVVYELIDRRGVGAGAAAALSAGAVVDESE